MGYKGERLKVKGNRSVSSKNGLSAQRSNRRFIAGLTVIAVLLLSSSCSISFKLNGANINYQTTHSISISDFPNNAPMVNPTLSNNLTESIRDLFQRQTRLQILRKGGDLELEGSIVGYDLSQGAISVDSYASESKLTIRVKVHFTNNVNPEDSFEKEYSAYQTFDASQMLSDVQDELCSIIIKEIADNIYNDTVAKW
ncbi:MAG: LptE family protein [Paludibacteraceae bacterium]|nr:LptE family protein [Paludibacteraceae bacterium]